MTKTDTIPGVRMLHPPRTGGTSIRNAWALRPPEYQGHGPYHGEEFAYGFCRNPWDRAVSLYHLLGRKTGDGRSFRDWLLDGMPVPPNSWGADVRMPCWWWLRHARWVGRFERRTEDLRQLAEILGREAPVEEHSGATERDPYPGYYDSETRDLIAVIYAVDIETYGYEFEGEMYDG